MVPFPTFPSFRVPYCADIKPRVLIGAPNFLLHVASMTPDILGTTADQLGVQQLVVGGEPGGGTLAMKKKKF